MNGQSIFSVSGARHAIALGQKRGLGFAGALHRVTGQLDDLQHDCPWNQLVGDVLKECGDARFA